MEPPASLPGCLVWSGRRQSYCGETSLDTGTPGLSVATSEARVPKPWSAGRAATLEIGGKAGPVSIPFTSGDAAATAVVLHPPHGPGAVISAGILPYLAYAVLYDAKAGTIGFKPRDPAGP